MQTIDLNDRSFAAQYSSSPITKKKVHVGPLVMSHWELGIEESSCHLTTCSSFFKWLSSTQRNEELDRYIQFSLAHSVYLLGIYTKNLLQLPQVMDYA